MATMSAAAKASAPERVVSKLNPANAVTASRFLCLPPFVWAVDNGFHQWATLFVLICGLLDKVDGLVAKIFNCRSVFGELFDAITDGICYGFCLIILAAYGWVPVIPVIAVIGLGLLNSALRAIYVKRVGRATNYKSYAMERIVAYTAYLLGFGTSNFEVDFYYWLFVPLMVVVVIHDAKRMLIDAIPGATA
ncbi:MAG: CDP-alcohol phosphatidyltransferase [Myxococcales bacterium]|nr:CDP-alcohol phosphatidyltransferase [Myxococcales bacterium]